MILQLIFHGAARRAMKKDSAVRSAIDKINIKAKVADTKTAFKEFGDKVKSKVLTPKRARGGTSSPFSAFIEKIKGAFGKLGGKGKGKVRVAYDGEYRGQVDYGGGTESMDEVQGPSPFDSWVARATIFCVSIFVVYFGVAWYTTKSLEEKINSSNKVIREIEAEIAKANSDADYIRTQTTEYTNKIEKLKEVMEVIETEKRKSNFDIPNFMSQVMFIIPQGVAITNINISDMGEVEIYAVSTQYAQLGYFVSKLKLENVLTDVNMEVLEMEQQIKIKVGGMLP